MRVRSRTRGLALATAFALALSLGHLPGRCRAGVVLGDRFDDESTFRLLGSARRVVEPEGEGESGRTFVELTGEAPSSTGAVWLRAPLDTSSSRTVITWEHSASAPKAAEGLEAGVQLILRAAESGETVDAIELGSGGAALGVEARPRPYVGVALDLAKSGTHDADGQHIEVNSSSDPSRDASVATSADLPRILEATAAGHRTRVSVVVEDRSTTSETAWGVEVFVTCEHEGFGARRVLATEVSFEVEQKVFVGVAATSAKTPVVHRVHGLRVDRDAQAPFFIRGDCNQDGVVCGGVSDMVAIVSRCFLGGTPPPCEAACDADANGEVCGSVTDVVFIANYCFGGSDTPPPAPFPSCGPGNSAPEDGRERRCDDPTLCGSRSAAKFIYVGQNDRGVDEYLRLRDEMILVLHPAGTFEQGDHYGDRGEDELPVHPTRLTQPFLLGKYEVTNAQYRRFLDAIGCRSPTCTTYDRSWDYTGLGAEEYDGSHYPEGLSGRSWSRNENYFESPEYAGHPVLWIDWFDAVAYARWANDERSERWQDFRVYGLPSEAQWEYAARWRRDGGTPSRYPWGGSEGDQNDPANINATLCNFGDQLGRTLPVHSLPAGRSERGVYQQSGNVYEWTADWYDPTVYQSAPLDDPFVFVGAVHRQLRGGGWFGVPFSQRGAYRCNWPQAAPDIDVGMRAAAVVPRGLLPPAVGE